MVIHADLLKPYLGPALRSWVEKEAVSQFDAVEKSEQVPGSSVSAAGEGRSQEGVTSAGEPTEFVPKMLAPVSLVPYDHDDDADQQKKLVYLEKIILMRRSLLVQLPQLSTIHTKVGKISIKFVADSDTSTSIAPQ